MTPPNEFEPGSPSSIDSLLGFSLDDESWLERLRNYSATPVPGRIGAYELLEEAGRGGQGVVYKALQPQTGRTIAVKRLIAGAFASREMRIRFDREIAAAAALDHPGIVTVFASDIVDGQAVLAMQWVDGQPVDCWADETKEVRDVLTLFTKICDAVHHAHQRGVIHRDLKPSNVLVDARGEPHVLDFGLARILSPLSPDAVFASHTTGFVGTPAYASPEHFSTATDAVDVRSDVYSIGSMLYHALTGRTPFADRHRFTELARAVEEADPPPPSSVRKELGREIDAIVLKALATAKADRYSSVDAFAEDIRRFLAGEPIHAHPPTAWYHARKLVLRHRAAFALSFTLLGVIVAFAITAGILALREHNAREDAEWNAYVASIAAASAALRADDSASALQHLERAAPRLRDWEWRYFRRQADGSASSAQLASQGIAIDDEGKVIAAFADGLPTANRRRDPVGAKAMAKNHYRRANFSPGLRWALQESSGELTHIPSDQRIGEWPFPISYATAFSPDERTLALADHTGQLKLVSLPDSVPARGRGLDHDDAAIPTRDLRLFTTPIEGLAFRADSLQIAASSGDGSVVILDLPAAQVMDTIPGNGSAVWAVAFSPDRRTLATGSWDKSVALWDLETKRALWRSTGHSELISTLAFSTDGTRLASGSWDKTLRVWNTAGGEPIARLVGHTQEPGSVAFLGGNDRLASFDAGGVLKTWRLGSNDRSIVEGAFNRIEGIAGSPGSIHGGWIAVAEGQDASWRNARLTLVSCSNRTKSHQLWIDDSPGESTFSGLFSAAASPDGRWLAAGAPDGTILLWRGNDLSALAVGATPTALPVTRLAINDPARCSLLAGESSWFGLAPGLSRCVPVKLSFSNDSRRLAVSRLDGSVDVWDVDRRINSVVARADASPYVRCTVAFLDDGERLAIIRWNETIQILDSRSGRILVEQRPALDQWESSRFVGRPHGELIPIGYGNDILLYHASETGLPRRLSGHQREVTAAAFSPDGRRLVSASYDNTLKLWDVDSGREVATLHGHEFRVTTVMFLDADTIVSGGHDNTVRFWDAN